MHSMSIKQNWNALLMYVDEVAVTLDNDMLASFQGECEQCTRTVETIWNQDACLHM